MSTNRVHPGSASAIPVSSFQYRQLVDLITSTDLVEDEIAREPEVSMTEVSLRQLIENERATARTEIEQKLREDYERRMQAESQRISATIANFEQSRKDYFAKVENEVVKLALSIAGKILHRESQVDPLLLSAIVQIAVGQLKEGSTAVLRVSLEEAERWTRHFESLGLKVKCTVQGEPDLVPGDCILETEIGSANFSLDVQLKEVERGFLDVLATRPLL